ncbi:MAG TPA: hypothetical protein VF310_14450 [Vicinamibacteria bacterium]|jgi:hypothetical protein
MKTIVSLVALWFVAGLVSPASAGTCVAHVKRTACKGQSAESYKKCAGKKECDVPLEGSAASAAECGEKVAKRDCPNTRLDITHSKVVTATFDGKPVTIDGQTDMCQTAHYPKAQRDKEFGVCKETDPN